MELTRLFNRLADKTLLLDVPGAGTPGMINCCHGGCDNCQFSHVFDEMSAGRIKWVALYPHRKHIDGREHTPPWLSMFADSQELLDKAAFMARLSVLPCASLSMGPPSGLESPADAPSPETLEAFWSVLQRQHQRQALSAGDMAQALKSATGAEHGAIWSEFKSACVKGG